MSTDEDRHPQIYPDGRIYRHAVGNYAPQEALQDHLQPTLSVVSGKPNAEEFVDIIRREFQICF